MADKAAIKAEIMRLAIENSDLEILADAIAEAIERLDTSPAESRERRIVQPSERR